MEEFINDNTIIKDDIYNMFKDSFTCFLCKNILIDPIICMKCQIDFCNKCIENWIKNENKCPKGCVEPNYQKSLLKNELLSKLKFKCTKCGAHILYQEVKKHHDECKGSENIQTSEIRNVRRLSMEEVDELGQNKNDITYIKSKKK